MIDSTDRTLVRNRLIKEGRFEASQFFREQTRLELREKKRMKRGEATAEAWRLTDKRFPALTRSQIRLRPSAALLTVSERPPSGTRPEFATLWQRTWLALAMLRARASHDDLAAAFILQGVVEDELWWSVEEAPKDLLDVSGFSKEASGVQETHPHSADLLWALADVLKLVTSEKAEDELLKLIG